MLKTTYLLSTFVEKNKPFPKGPPKEPIGLKVTSEQVVKIIISSAFKEMLVQEAVSRIGMQHPRWLKPPKTHLFSILDPESENHKRFLKAAEIAGERKMDAISVDMTDFNPTGPN